MADAASILSASIAAVFDKGAGKNLQDTVRKLRGVGEPEPEAPGEQEEALRG